MQAVVVRPEDYPLPSTLPTLAGSNPGPSTVVWWGPRAANLIVLPWHQPAVSEGLAAPDLSPYRIREVNWRGRHLRLRHEIECRVSLEDGLYVIEYEPLGILAYAESRSQAIRDFNEELVVIWDEYSNEPDSALTRSAIDLKRRLRALVSEK